MKKWQFVTVGDLGRIVTGKTPKTAIRENYGGNIPFLTPSDDMAVRYVTSTAKRLTDKGLEEVKNVLLPPNSVCVSCIGSDLGKAVMTTEPTVTNQQINSIIVNEERFDAHFVYYAMLILGKELNFISKTSTAVPIVNKSSFSSYKIMCPSLELQKKIAAILSALDSKIECNQKINDNLERQVMAVYSKRFIATDNSERNICCAGEYFDISIGKTPPRKESQWFSNNPSDVTWVSISDMGSCGLYINSSSEQLTPEAVEKHNVIIVPANTVLLSFKLTIGRIAITDGEMTTNEAIAHFKTDNKVINEYLYCYLKRFDYQTMGSTSSIATAVNSKIIKGMPFVVPTDSEIAEFHIHVKPMFDLIKLNLKEIERLTNIRDTLLPQLMSGEIDVSTLDF